MGSILDKMRAVAINVLAPGVGDRVKAALQQSDYISEVYLKQRPAAVLPHEWLRGCNELGETVAFKYTCDCQTVTFRDVFEALRDHVCPNCKDKFNLMKAVGIDTAKVPVSQWKSIIDHKLRIYPNVIGQPVSPGVVPIGDWGGSPVSAATEGWDGKPPQGSDGGWV